MAKLDCYVSLFTVMDFVECMLRPTFQKSTVIIDKCFLKSPIQQPEEKNSDTASDY